MRNIIYILGCNRSGTTLLQNLFRCSKDTKIVNGEVSPQIMAKFKNEFPEKNLVFKRIMMPAFGMGAMSRAPLEAELRQGRSERPNPTIWLDWATMWDKIKYVHIRRDPRDALVSTFGKRSYVNAFPMWKDAEKIYERLLEEVPDNISLVKYEELVKNVDNIMGELFEKIGLEKFHEFQRWTELLDKRDKSHQSMRWLNSPRPVDSNSIGNWVKEKNLERIQQIIKMSPEIIDDVVKYEYDKEGWEKELDED